MIRFIHITDTHIGSSKDFVQYGVRPYVCAETLISHINNFKVPVDFILHTGDVAATKPYEEEYKTAQGLLKKINYPVYYATGNHDRSSFILQYLKQGAREPLVQDKTKNAYRFDKSGYQFIVLDARGPDEIDPHGSLSEDQFEALEKEIETSSLPLIVCLHYPPITLDSPWINENMLLLEGDRMHNVFKKAGSRLLAVFFGHIHRGLQMVKDGVFYSSVGSTFMQFQSFPSQKEPYFESTGRSYFNYVKIADGEIMIKEYSIPNGNEIFVKTRGAFKN